MMDLIVFLCFSCDYFNCLINAPKLFIFISFRTVVVFENPAAVKLESACLTADLNAGVCVNLHTTYISACTTAPFTALFFLSVDQGAVRNPWRKNSDVKHHQS